MSDRTFPCGPVDFSRVDLTEAHDFHYWTHRFACSPHQLLDALRAAGVEAVSVGRYFAVSRAAAIHVASS